MSCLIIEIFMYILQLYFQTELLLRLDGLVFHSGKTNTENMIDMEDCGLQVLSNIIGRLSSFGQLMLWNNSFISESKVYCPDLTNQGSEFRNVSEWTCFNGSVYVEQDHLCKPGKGF